MKILVLTDRFPPFSTGGYDIGCQEIVEALKSRGDEVIVITTKYGISGRQSKEPHVYRILGYSDLSRLKNPGTYLIAQAKRALICRRNAAILKKMLGEINPDLVYGFQLWDTGLLAIKTVQRCGFPLVFDIQDYWLSEYRHKLVLRPQKWRRFMAALLNGIYDFSKLDFRHLYVISETLKKAYRQAGFSGEIKVIPRGIKFENIPGLSSRKDPLPGQLRLFYAGRLTAEKGPDIAIKAWGVLAQKFPHTEITLSIAGEGEPLYVDYLKKIAGEFKFKGRVKFLGKLTRADLMQEYGRHDLLLFPSAWIEPWGVTVIEAMACGLPVIATDQGGPQEMITDKKDGFLFSPGDYQGAAGIVEALIKNPALYEQARVSGYQMVKEKYNFNAMMERIHNYLLSVPAGAKT